jgi:hypothetical protein
MPARRKASSKVDTTTGAILDGAPDTTHQRLESAIAQEAASVRRWLRPDGLSRHGREIMYGLAILALISIGAVLGAFTKELMERHTSNAAIAAAMRTAIPVVRSTEVEIDPGKYDGKLLDVVMNVTKGGVYKSGKGLYLQEREQGVSLVVFQSAFAGFGEGMEEHPDRIVAQYIGKYVKARGTVRSAGAQQDGSRRLSMVIYAPGLLSEIPER